MSKPIPRFAAVFLLVILLSACQTPATPVPPVFSPTSSPILSPTSSETAAPSSTATPSMTSYMTRTATRTRFPTVYKTATADPLDSLGKIAFFYNNDLYTIRPNGKDRTLVRELVEMCQGVSWSPDGKRLVYSVGNLIGITAADGSSYYTITGKGARNISSLDPDWSPDGARIAYITDKSLREDPDSPFRYADLFLMRTDGTGAINLSPNQPVHSGDPDWSPSGKWIAFRYGDEIYIVDALSGAMNPLATEGTCELSNPSWSPDGTRIAFERVCNYKSQIFIIPVEDPTKRTALTPSPTVKSHGASHPTWSPDGQYIAYSLDGEVCIMGVENKYSRCLTKGVEPDWSWAVE